MATKAQKGGKAIKKGGRKSKLYRDVLYQLPTHYHAIFQRTTAPGPVLLCHIEADGHTTLTLTTDATPPDMRIDGKTTETMFGITATPYLAAEV